MIHKSSRPSISKDLESENSILKFKMQKKKRTRNLRQLCAWKSMVMANPKWMLKKLWMKTECFRGSCPWASWWTMMKMTILILKMMKKRRLILDKNSCKKRWDYPLSNLNNVGKKFIFKYLCNWGNKMNNKTYKTQNTHQKNKIIRKKLQLNLKSAIRLQLIKKVKKY